MEQALKDNDPEALHACKQYVVRTLLTWIVNFCWCARAELNTDVLLSGSPAMTDNQLGPLVEFLTKHHRNAKATGGD